jgi:hypothetical protein
VLVPGVSQEAQEGGGGQLIKIRLVCDHCDAVISDGISANEVRFQANALYRKRKCKDLCLACAGGCPTARRPPPTRLGAPRLAGLKKVDDVGR